MQDIHWYEIAQCEDNPDMINYKTFSDIPEGRVNDSSLVAWVVSGGKLAQIPVEMRTEPVLWSAVRNDSEAYDLILPEDVTDPRSLPLEALRHSKAFFTSVPEAYKDEQFLLRFVNEQGKLLPRRITGTSQKYQKRVSQAVKRARHLALMPYVADMLK